MLTFSSSRPSLNADFIPAEVLQQETDEEIVVEQEQRHRGAFLYDVHKIVFIGSSINAVS